MKYKLKLGTHTRYEDGRRVTLQQGDVFEPSDAEIQAFGDKLESVGVIVEMQPDNELEELREKAKQLGVENASRMGKDRLLKEIASKEEEQLFDLDDEEEQ